MSNIRNRMIPLSILIAALALVLSGCGDAKENEDTSSKYASKSSELKKSDDGGKEYIRASVGGELKEFRVANSAGLGGSTSITGSFDSSAGQEMLKISMKGISSAGSFTLDNDMTVMYKGPDGTWLASSDAKEHGASFKVVIDDYDAYAVGTFSGTLVRVDLSSGQFLSIDVKDGKFSIPVQRR